jgi:hypothetical protein
VAAEEAELGVFDDGFELLLIWLRSKWLGNCELDYGLVLILVP